MTIHTNHVVEVMMATPDIICLRVRDANVIPGSLLQLAAPDAGAISAIVQRDPVTGGAGTKYARVVGQVNGEAKRYLRFLEEPPAEFVDRDAVDDVDNWSDCSLGGRSVTGVHRVSKPYGQGYYGASGYKIIACEHRIFLHLDGDLDQGGPYYIRIDGSTFPATKFVFNDKVTRAYGLQASHLGFRPGCAMKIADFSVHIPGFGTEGRVNLIGDYALDDFELIDEDGVVVHTGTLTQFLAPTDVEPNLIMTTGLPGSSQAAQNIYYASTTTPPKVATGVSDANPRVITIPNHDYVDQSVKYFRGFATSAGTSLEFDAGMKLITVLDNDTFSIVGTPVGTWAAGKYLEGFDSRVFDTFLANRYATYVHRADFSAFVTPGRYRIRIPGLGVSDSFPIVETAYFPLIQEQMRGYYNQLHHDALDYDVGRWDRPSNFVDGVNGVEVYESYLPAGFSSEIAFYSSYDITASLAVNATWKSATRVNGYEGSYVRDAGDWDTFSGWHPQNGYLLLEYGYRHLPVGVRDLNLGWPKKASSVDPVLFAGTDGMCDQFHMAVAAWHGFYKYQKPDGRVYSGITFSGGGGSQTTDQEASHYARDIMVLNAADPVSQCWYLMTGAKIAQVLGEAGFTAARNTITAKMETAFAWAEDMYQDYLAHKDDGNNLADATLIQDYFVTTLDIKTRMGWNDATFSAAMTQVFADRYHAQAYRMMAAATLYNLTDDTYYGDMAAFPGAPLSAVVPLSGNTGLAIFEFVQPPSATAYTFVASGNNMVSTYNTSAFNGWQTSGTHLYRPWEEIVRAFFFDLTSAAQDETNEYLLRMHQITSQDTGRLQGGLSMTTALPRGKQTVLLRDAEAMALSLKDMPGIRVYYNFTNTLSGGINVNNFTSDSPAVWTVESDTGAFAYHQERRIEPLRYQTPLIECSFDNSFCIYMNEFTTQQSIVPQMVMAIIQHCWDGNPASVPVLNKIRMKLRRAGAE